MFCSILVRAKSRDRSSSTREGTIYGWQYRGSWCDLKNAQMNVQRSLLRELMLQEFKLSHNTGVEAKNICWVKGEAAVDQSTVYIYIYIY